MALASNLKDFYIHRIFSAANLKYRQNALTGFMTTASITGITRLKDHLKGLLQTTQTLFHLLEEAAF